MRGGESSELKYARTDSSERGGVLMMALVTCAVLIAIAGFAIDLTRAYREQRRIHNATDAGAYAAAAKLIDGVSDFTDVSDEARIIADANGLLSAEIPNSGGVQVGRWHPDSRTFEPMDTFANDLNKTNAVRVRGRRTIATVLASFFGQDQVSTKVDSVVYVGGANQVSCMIPFAVPDALVEGKTYGDQIEISGRDAPGNWGKIDLGGINYSSDENFQRDILTGTCSVEVNIGDLISPGTGGNPKICDGFLNRLHRDPAFVMGQVPVFLPGDHDVEITGFVSGRIMSVCNKPGEQCNPRKCTGNDWVVTVRLEPGFAGSSATGGPPIEPGAFNRVLVQ